MEARRRRDGAPSWRPCQPRQHGSHGMHQPEQLAARQRQRAAIVEVGDRINSLHAEGVPTSVGVSDENESADPIAFLNVRYDAQSLVSGDCFRLEARSSGAGMRVPE
jgi:hypothetical protein